MKRRMKADVERIDRKRRKFSIFLACFSFCSSLISVAVAELGDLPFFMVVLGELDI